MLVAIFEWVAGGGRVADTRLKNRRKRAERVEDPTDNKPARCFGAEINAHRSAMAMSRMARTRDPVPQR
jgi:hypothetical protein